MSDVDLDLRAVNRNPSLYVVVSRQLLDAIRSANLAPGDKIPPERELAERFGVSRTVIRETIRHLAAKGVLEARSGSGVHVADVGHEVVSDSLGLFLRQRGPLDPEKIGEVRECLEIRTVELAARRASDEQIAHIVESCERLPGLENDAAAASVADVAFHRSIAEATGNELFLVLLDSLGEILLHIRQATLGEPRRVKETVRQHRKIAEALQRRDEAASVEAMRSHLSDSLLASRRAAKKSDGDW